MFRLGLRQGLYCLGCCWAMMLLMFAVGVMNVVWMAVLGVVMAIEKIGTHDAVLPRARRRVHRDRRGFIVTSVVGALAADCEVGRGRACRKTGS